MHRLGLTLDDRLGRGIAFSDPWALIEEFGDFIERREIKFHDLRAERRNACDVSGESGLGLSVAIELLLVFPRHADLQPRRDRRQDRRRKASGIGIGVVVTEGDNVGREGVVHVQRE